MSKYDVAIIGAGMSGLAAGIRLAHYGRRVVILDRHRRIGGMNSWYRRAGREFDTGLHAMTNFSPLGARGAPLGKLLRQLRLRYQELDLVEQNFSVIRFPQAELRFSNHPQELADSIGALFPGQVDGWLELRNRIREFPSLVLDDLPPLSARAVLAEHLSEPLLREMLLCPLMYYGNAREHDMDFAQFCVMFQSVFEQGLCRPRGGIRPLLQRLASRYQEAGGELRLGSGVRALHLHDQEMRGIELDSGESLEAEAVLSSAGYPETMALCQPEQRSGQLEIEAETSPMSFVEAIFVCKKPMPSKIGGDPTIVFHSDTMPFRYHCPQGLVEPSSKVICLPDNFAAPDPDWRERGESRIRLTRIASYQQWAKLDKAEYGQAKKETRDNMLRDLQAWFGGAVEEPVAEDLFTPRTIEKYTGRRRGAVYGSPIKRRQGRTPIDNLFICGTDQGFHGITGAMLSGVSMANHHFLR